MKNAKIESEKEAKKVAEYLAKTTMDMTGCDRQQAVKRMEALFESGLLKSANPDSPHTRSLITIFMLTPVA